MPAGIRNEREKERYTGRSQCFYNNEINAFTVTLTKFSTFHDYYILPYYLTAIPLLIDAANTRANTQHIYTDTIKNPYDNDDDDNDHSFRYALATKENNPSLFSANKN
uniref:Uncharacterized protein n=1 Tax=Glossina pallidipes TaxID=7398 RepID=A0A1A9ZDL5_GLOPL